MKKLFAMVAAAGMLFVTSCAKDAAESYAEGNDGVVTFTLALEKGAGTRVISDGTGADKLVYRIYGAEGNELSAFNQKVESDIEFPYTLTLRLVKGQTYKIAFWAQDSDCTAYNTDDLKAVTVDYAGLNNDETRDAFYGVETFTVTGAAEIAAVLRRPFAQINVGTTEDDWTAAEAAGFTVSTSKAVVAKVATTLNVLDGTVSGEKAVTYDFAEIPAELLNVDADGDGEAEEYKYLSMCYVLVPQEKSTLSNLEFTFHPESDEAVDFTLAEGLTNVPVQRNWRTNIVGNLLTGEITFKIIIDPGYDGDYTGLPWTATLPDGVEYDAATETVTISTEEGLKWLSDATNGVYEAGLYKDLKTVKRKINGQDTDYYYFKHVVLAENTTFDLSAYNWRPVYVPGGCDFDGNNVNGTVVENLTANVEGEATAAFIEAFTSSVKNVTVRNVNLTGNYNVAGIVHGGYTSVENCHVEGGTLISTPWEKTPGVYDDGNNVGGIVSFWQPDGGAYTIKDCSVSNLYIKAFRKVGGIIGFAGNTKATIEGCSVSNTTIVADMLEIRYDKYVTRQPQAGKIAGNEAEENACSTITGCTDDETTVEVLTPEESGIETGDLALAQAGAELGYDITFSEDITAAADDMLSGIYGSNFAALVQKGGTIDGNNNTLKTSYYTSVNGANKENYGIYTYGGTIKNLTTTGSFRGVYIAEKMTGDVVIENCTLGGAYALNTAGSNNDYKLTVKETEIIGWSSWSALSSAEFTDCTFTVGNAFSNPVYNSLCRAYINTTFTNCKFPKGWTISLIPQSDDTIFEFNGCTVDGEPLTRENINFELLFYKTATEKGQKVVVHYTESATINFKIDGTLYTEKCPGGDEEGHTH